MNKNNLKKYLINFLFFCIGASASFYVNYSRAVDYKSLVITTLVGYVVVDLLYEDLIEKSLNNKKKYSYICSSLDEDKTNKHLCTLPCQNKLPLEKNTLASLKFYEICYMQDSFIKESCFTLMNELQKKQGNKTYNCSVSEFKMNETQTLHILREIYPKFEKSDLIFTDYINKKK